MTGPISKPVSKRPFALNRRELLQGAAGAGIAANLPAIALSAPVRSDVEARLVRLLDADRAILLLDGRQVTLNRGAAHDGWTLVELVADPEPFLVLENFAQLDAPMLIVDSTGVRERFGKTAESTSQDIPSPYLGHSWAEVTESPTDLLGRDILGRRGDPDYERVASAFPPIRTVWGDTYNFLGTPQSMDKVWFMYGGRSPNFDPAVAPETRRLAKGEWASAYCSPAELSIPLVTRWLLAFEDPRDETLWLAKGMPRQWLAAGTPIEVQRIPTRWGRVGYRLEPRGNLIRATVQLPDSGVPQGKVRLRHPEERRLRSVTINGRSAASTAFDGETITLPPGVAGKIEIVARFA